MCMWWAYQRVNLPTNYAIYTIKLPKTKAFVFTTKQSFCFPSQTTDLQRPIMTTSNSFPMALRGDIHLLAVTATEYRSTHMEISISAEKFWVFTQPPPIEFTVALIWMRRMPFCHRLFAELAVIKLNTPSQLIGRCIGNRFGGGKPVQRVAERVGEWKMSKLSNFPLHCRGGICVAVAKW